MSLVRRVAAAVLLGGVVYAGSALCAEDGFVFPESGLSVGGRVTLLAIDDRSLRDRENLTLTLTKPTVRKEPVLTPEYGNPSAPDSMASHFYGSVIYHDGVFQMWYYAVSLGDGPEKLKQGPVCYAESRDGLHWTKPELGQVAINGSTANNALALPDEVTQCAAVIIDESERDPDKRYKMLYVAMTSTWVFHPATSPDGIHWTASSDYPTDRFLEMGSFYRFGDRYIAHGQGIGADESGNSEGRQGYASTSADFVHWDRDYVDAFRLPEPEDIALRGLIGDYPQVHLGIGATPFGSVAVGLYGIWHNPPVNERRKEGWYGAGLITCDLGLVVSNDGVAFREPVPGAVYIAGTESPATAGSNPSDPTILCQANGILNVGDTTYIYHGRWRNATNTVQDYYAEVGVATLPRDRWGSLAVGEGEDEGTAWSAPVTLPDGGCTVTLNADFGADITVELADEEGELLAGFSGENHGVVHPDGVVGWSDETLARLGGKTVRIKLGLTGETTHLYAVYLDGLRNP